MPKMLDEKRLVTVEERIFAANFKMARLAANITQMDVQAQIGIGQRFISDVENLKTGIGIDTMCLFSRPVKTPLYHLLDAGFPATLEKRSPEIWLAYAKQIDELDGVPFERKVLARNFKQARIDAGLSKVRVAELASVSYDSLVYFERAEMGIYLSNATKLAQVLHLPLYKLLIP